jgi:diguanylate cyclase (GGDEF)-like protein
MARKKVQKREKITSLTPKELEVLKWVQEGKTNDEIATIIGNSKWTVKFHLKNVMKKLSVTTRAQAVSQAIGEGMLQPLEPTHPAAAKPGPRVKVGIVGCGKGGSAVLKILKDNPLIDIRWVAEKNYQAPGVELASKLNIPVEKNYKKVVGDGVDIIIEVTGSKDVRRELERIKPADTELIGGNSALLLWQLVDERRKRHEEREKILKQHEGLYHMGFVIENIQSLKDVAYALVDYATGLTNTPAGSLALFDERREEMVLLSSKGFSEDFNKVERWEIRKGELTNEILNQNEQVFISDLREHPHKNRLLLKEGVRTVLAAPLSVEGRIVGILSVNDFKKRKFRAEDVSLFSLLTLYAALTVERVRSIEELQLLSVTDGLTGLYNQRYLIEQIKREINRAQRHGRDLSVIMLDIDHFKSYNDRFGHLEGNKVLKALAKLFMKNVRTNDTVSRFGGEEFCIIAPELDKLEAVKFAKRIIKESSRLPLLKKKLTLSGGVSTYPEDGKGHFQLIEKADSSLYMAKGLGRSRICS